MGKMTLEFEVKRIRPSVTQGEAQVFCNGQFITNFGDEPKPIQKGEAYYGDLIGGYASTTPDEDFIYAALWHRYDFIYHISDPVRKIVNRRRFDEEQEAIRKGENKLTLSAGYK